MDYQKSEQRAWLRLVHTEGIGVKRARSIFRTISEAGLPLEALFSERRGESWQAPGVSAGLIRKIREQGEERARKRWEDLQRRSLQLLHPGSSLFDVPDIPGLPPALCLRGRVEVLRSPHLTVLLKSRDAHTAVIIEFLRRVADGEGDRRTWCFCPFSKRDWELVESLIKINSEVVLGLASGIPKRVEMLEAEYPGCRLTAIAPEPALHSRWAQFSCIEAFYDLFCSLASEALLVHVRKGGKTAARVKRAERYNCRVINYENDSGSVTGDAAYDDRGVRNAADKFVGGETPDNDEDDGFVFSL